MKQPTIDAIALLLERAWNAALPGKGTCERDSVWRELQRLRWPAPIKPPQLRLVAK